MITTLVAASVLASGAGQQDTIKPDSVIRLDEYVIRATRAAASRKLDDAAALSVATPTHARRAAGVVAADLFRDISGVHVQQTSAGQGAIVLRGMVGNQVLMLVNGVPMNNATYRDGPGQYLATIDPETIQLIEVVRGPASVVYGSDAQGGVINVVTEPHPFLGERSVRVAGSASTSNLGYRGRFSAGLANDTWRIGVGGTLVSAGDLRAGGGLGRQVPTGFDAGGLDAEIEFLAGQRHTLSGAVHHFNMVDVPRYDRYWTLRAPAPGPDAEHLFQPQTRQLGYTRYEFRRGGGAITELDVTASLAVQREGRRRVRLRGGAADSIRERWRDDVYTPGVSVVGRSFAALGATVMRVTWGAEYYRDELRSSGEFENLNSGTSTPIVRASAGGDIPAGNFPNGASADRLGVFAAVDVPILDHFTLTAGGRLSTFRSQANNGTAFGGAVRNSASQLTGQIGVVAAPHRDWRIVARVAQGFRAPNLYDLTRVGPVPGGVSLPNPNASPERSITTDVSLRYAAPATAFDITGYHTSISDFIDRVPGSFAGDTLFNGERVFQGLNVGKARVWGIEAEAAQRIEDFQLRANIVFTHGNQTPVTGVEEPMSKIPPVNGMVGLRWNPLASRFWTEYQIRWSVEQDRLGSRDLSDSRIPAGGTPGYAVHGIRAGASLSQRIDVSAGFENLTDTLYRTHASGVDAAARHVWIGLSWVGGI